MPRGAWDGQPQPSSPPAARLNRIAGLDPLRLLDGGYAGFLDLVGGSASADADSIAPRMTRSSVGGASKRRFA